MGDRRESSSCHRPWGQRESRAGHGDREKGARITAGHGGRKRSSLSTIVHGEDGPRSAGHEERKRRSDAAAIAEEHGVVVEKKLRAAAMARSTRRQLWWRRKLRTAAMAVEHRPAATMPRRPWPAGGARGGAAVGAGRRGASWW
ncbi:unnamed protein product [Urochloa humidicola]